VQLGGSAALKFGAYYQQVAEEYGCHFLNTADYIVSSDLDGVHLDASEHEKLGKAVASKVRNIFQISGGNQT
jgi:lysophospholipase L1-like esterase